MNRTHLVRNRTDPANPRDDVRHFLIMSALQECFEEPRRLEDLEFYVLNRAVFHGDTKRAFALNARDHINGNGPCFLLSLRLCLFSPFHFSPFTPHISRLTPYPLLPRLPRLAFPLERGGIPVDTPKSPHD